MRWRELSSTPSPPAGSGSAVAAGATGLIEIAPLYLTLRRYSATGECQGEGATDTTSAQSAAPHPNSPLKRGEETLLEQSLDLPLLVEADVVRARHLGQARHGHDLAGDDDQELRARRQPHLADRDHVVGRRILEIGVGRERILRL